MVVVRPCVCLPQMGGCVLAEMDQHSTKMEHPVLEVTITQVFKGFWYFLYDTKKEKLFLKPFVIICLLFYIR